MKPPHSPARAMVAALVLACSICAARSAQAQGLGAPPSARGADAHCTRIILLGTAGGPMPRVQRSQPASLLVVDGTAYLIDAGAGVVRRLTQAGFKPDQVRAIFITHHHLDHTAGLEPLMAFIEWSRASDGMQGSPVHIYGPPATSFLVHASLEYLSVTERILGSEFMLMPKAAATFRAHDIKGNGVFYEDGIVRVIAVENTHFHFERGSPAYLAGDKSYSYRFDTPNGSVVFTGDTGPSAAVTRLATGADMLVSEVIDGSAMARTMQTGQVARHMRPDQARAVAFHMLQEHLSPEAVGAMAAQAHVGLVILTHIVPGADGEADTTGYSAGVKRLYSGPVIVGRDLFEYNLYKPAPSAKP